jgi:hypothetical protein
MRAKWALPHRLPISIRTRLVEDAVSPTVVIMDRDESAALAHAAIVVIGFLFTKAKSHEGTRYTAHAGTDTSTGHRGSATHAECTRQRPTGYHGANTRNCQGTDADK